MEFFNNVSATNVRIETKKKKHEERIARESSGRRGTGCGCSAGCVVPYEGLVSYGFTGESDLIG